MDDFTFIAELDIAATPYYRTIAICASPGATYFKVICIEEPNNYQ